MENVPCPVCGRMTAPTGISWTGWRAGIGDARGTTLALHGPRGNRCPGREFVAAHVSARELTYTAAWVAQVGPVPDECRVEVFDHDPDAPLRHGNRVVEPGVVWLTLINVTTGSRAPAGGPLRTAAVPVVPAGDR